MPDKKAPAEAVTTPAKPAGDGAGKPRKKGNQLTHGALVAQTVAQSGKCWVTGEPLGTSIAVVDGKLVTSAIGKLAGGDGLVTLKAKIGNRLVDAKKTQETYGKLADEKGNIVFASERAKPDDKAPEKVASGPPAG